MTAVERSAKRRHLALLAQADLERLGRRKSVMTWVADIGFWLVYGGVCGLVIYIAYCGGK